jgi:2-amino-4-hydroxy-6-hydroxymethyldihydropteridine diphosphokinase
MATALISLGSNLGDRKATLDAAVEKLRQAAGIDQVVASSYHATKPVGGPEGQDEFLNAAARLRTSLSPRELLTELQRIEQELGRERQERWGPRTVDLDLLLYDDLVINEPDLIVPHRFLPFRRFVLEPAVEVAGIMQHSQLAMGLGALLDRLNTFPRIYEVGGLISTIRRDFTQRVAAQLTLAIAQREVLVNAESGEVEIKTTFRTFDGKALDSPPDSSFIAEDSFAELIYRSPLIRPLRWSQLAEGLLERPATSFFSLALFQLDASNSWLIGADRGLALLGRNAEAYCDQFRSATERYRQMMPTLLLPADDLDRAVREAVAAIKSME